MPLLYKGEGPFAVVAVVGKTFSLAARTRTTHVFIGPFWTLSLAVTPKRAFLK
jgi:hypothetical protein